MLFKSSGLVMLPTSLFAVFAALAAPEYAAPRAPVDPPLALEPAEWDAEYDEFEPAADPDFKTLDSRDDGLVERDNPHHPAPNSPACKKKVNEPKGCPPGK